MVEKQEEMFKIKQGDLSIKDEYISDPVAGLTEDHVKTHFPHEHCASEDYNRLAEAKSTITKHFKTLYKCFQCGFNKFYLNRHESGKTNEYFCAKCRYSTKRVQDLFVHSSKKPHHCKQCDYKTSRKCDLKQHVMLTHSSKEPHHCQQCDFKTYKKGALKQHMLTHGEKPYHCKQCDFKTSREQYLKQHQLLHRRKKPLCCNHCNFKTLGKNCLRQHLLLHSSEKPCDSVKQHQLVHPSDHKTSSKEKLLADYEIVPIESVVFNCMDFVIKEEPK